MNIPLPILAHSRNRPSLRRQRRSIFCNTPRLNGHILAKSCPYHGLLASVNAPKPAAHVFPDPRIIEENAMAPQPWPNTQNGGTTLGLHVLQRRITGFGVGPRTTRDERMIAHCFRLNALNEFWRLGQDAQTPGAGLALGHAMVKRGEQTPDVSRLKRT